MTWSRDSLTVCALLDEELADVGCERRMTFVGPAYVLGGRVFAVVHRGRVALRLPPDEAVALLSDGDHGAWHLERMPGLVLLPESASANPERLRTLLRRAVAYAMGHTTRHGR